ncbi:MAG: YncE family protein [Rhodomicrobium sp.]
MSAFKAFVAALLLFAGAAAAQDSTASSYKIVSRIAGPDGGWDLLDVDSVRGRLYVARTGGVMAVDLATSTVTADLVKGSQGHGALVIPGTSQVIATNGANGTAVIFEGATGQIIATLTVGTKPDAIAFDPATKTIWVMNPGSGDISVIDPVAAKVIDTVAVEGSLELAAADGEGRLYVNVEDKNDVAVIDTRSRKLIERFALAGCDGPTGVAYAPDAKLILSACKNGVAKIMAADGHEVARLAVGARPDGALYDVNRHLAFVPSGGDGTLSIISLSPSPKVVGVVATAKGARTAALDTSTGRIYLPSAQFALPAGNTRPSVIPGSFEILVVAPVANLHRVESGAIDPISSVIGQ